MVLRSRIGSAAPPVRSTSMPFSASMPPLASRSTEIGISLRPAALQLREQIAARFVVDAEDADAAATFRTRRSAPWRRCSRPCRRGGREVVRRDVEQDRDVEDRARRELQLVGATARAHRCRRPAAVPRQSCGVPILPPTWTGLPPWRRMWRDQRRGGRLAVGAGDADIARPAACARYSSSMSPRSGMPAALAARRDRMRRGMGVRDAGAQHQHLAAAPVGVGEIARSCPRLGRGARRLAVVPRPDRRAARPRARPRRAARPAEAEHGNDLACDVWDADGLRHERMVLIAASGWRGRPAPAPRR